MKLFVGALAMVMLAGCASSAISVRDATPVPRDEIYGFQTKPAEPSGKITVVRDGGAVGSGCDLVFYIDGRKAAKLGQGQRATFLVPAGAVNVGAGLANSGLCGGAAVRTISANVKANQESLFRLSVDMSGFYLSPYVDYE